MFSIYDFSNVLDCSSPSSPEKSATKRRRDSDNGVSVVPS